MSKQPNSVAGGKVWAPEQEKPQPVKTSHMDNPDIQHIFVGIVYIVLIFVGFFAIPAIVNHVAAEYSLIENS